MATAPVDVYKHRGKFFEVLQQTERSQTAVMTLEPGLEAGPEETHLADQVIYVIEGEAAVRVAGKHHKAAAGALFMVPAGTPHHVANPGRVPLFLVTVYAPPAY